MCTTYKFNDFLKMAKHMISNHLRLNWTLIVANVYQTGHAYGETRFSPKLTIVIDSKHLYWSHIQPVMNTLLHEIAHAKLYETDPRHHVECQEYKDSEGHCSHWKDIAISLKNDGSRYADYPLIRY